MIPIGIFSSEINNITVVGVLQNRSSLYQEGLILLVYTQLNSMVVHCIRAFT